MTSTRLDTPESEDTSTAGASWWRGPGMVASFVIGLAVLVGNAAYIFGVRSNNPILYHSGLGSPTLGVTKAPFAYHHAAHTIDANDGWTAQALGHLAAQMWAHGEVPLWNIHEGLGTPLAGEMQSAAFFLPFVLLQLLPNGIFAMHLALELVAGLTTLAFLRRLGLGWVAATLGGVLFALNGVFAVMTNAPFNPVAFLPMCLWGVELVRDAVRGGRRPVAGLITVALGLAWMLYAGFPETALLEGLFVGLWTLVRGLELPARRVRFFLWSALAAMAGCILAAPMLAAMKSFLGIAYTAYHAGGSAAWSYQPVKATAFASPFLGGPLGLNDIFGGLAGFVTLPVVFFAIVGFLGRRSIGLRLVTGVPLVLLLGNAFGLSAANKLLNLVPGMTIVLVYKYGLVIIAFLLILLAAFGVDDVARRSARRRSVIPAACLTAGYLGVSAWYGYSHGRFPHAAWTASVLAWSVVVLVLLTFAASWRRHASAVVLVVAALVGLDGVGSYMVPQLSAGRPARVDTGPIHYLERHLGTSKFFSLGPIQPNYGSYWGLSQLNVNDLPVPQKFRDFVLGQLKPAPGTPASHVTGWAFTHGDELAPMNFDVRDAKGILRAYGQQQQAYRDAGVEYLVMGHGVADADTTSKLGLVRVFSSKKAEIWRDPAAVSDMTTSGGGCEVLSATSDEASVHCSSSGRLTRRQLSAPGWEASVDGRTVVLPTKPLYQTLPLPAGSSTVRFEYRPAYFRSAVAASLLVLVWLTLEGVRGVVLSRRRRVTDRDSTGQAGGATVLTDR